MKTRKVNLFLIFPSFSQNQIWCWPLTRDYMIGKPGNQNQTENVYSYISRTGYIRSQYYIHIHHITLARDFLKKERRKL